VAIATLLGAIITLIRLIVGNVAKRRAGVAAKLKDRDRDLIRERDKLKREVSHLERQKDTEHRNAQTMLDRFGEARRKAVELYGKQVADEMFGETPRLEQTFTYDEIREMNGRNYREPPTYS
jgi:hypothetical protein